MQTNMIHCDCVSLGPACTNLKHKISSGKLGQGSLSSLTKWISLLYMTVRSICYDLMLKFPAQVRLQMRSNACSTINIILPHEAYKGKRRESHHHGSCRVPLVPSALGFSTVVAESHMVHSQSVLNHPSLA